MSFDEKKWKILSTGQYSNDPRTWGYDSDENIDFITASGYFNDVYLKIRKNDLIYISVNDRTEFFIVISDTEALPVEIRNIENISISGPHRNINSPIEIPQNTWIDVKWDVISIFPTRNSINFISNNMFLVNSGIYLIECDIQIIDVSAPSNNALAGIRLFNNDILLSIFNKSITVKGMGSGTKFSLYFRREFRFTESVNLKIEVFSNISGYSIIPKESRITINKNY